MQSGLWVPCDSAKGAVTLNIGIALNTVCSYQFPKRFYTTLTSCTGEAGLEVCAGKGTTPQQAMQSGLWVPCDPVEWAITVNIGDALQYWSDGQLKSTYHRVRMPRAGDRQAGLCHLQNCMRVL